MRRIITTLLVAVSLSYAEKTVYLEWNLFKKDWKPTFVLKDQFGWGKVIFKYHLFGDYKIKTKVLKTVTLSYGKKRGFKYSYKPKIVRTLEKAYKDYKKSKLSSGKFGGVKNLYLIYCSGGRKLPSCPLKRFYFKEGDLLTVSTKKPTKEFTLYIEGFPCKNTDAVILKVLDLFGDEFFSLNYSRGIFICNFRGKTTVFSPSVVEEKGIRLVLLYSGFGVKMRINGSYFECTVPKGWENSQISDFLLLEIFKGCFFVKKLALYPHLLSGEELFILEKGF